MAWNGSNRRDFVGDQPGFHAHTFLLEYAAWRRLGEETSCAEYAGLPRKAALLAISAMKAMSATTDGIRWIEKPDMEHPRLVGGSCKGSLRWRHPTMLKNLKLMSPSELAIDPSVHRNIVRWVRDGKVG